MNVLMLTPYFPYPPSGGGHVRTYNLLQHLQKQGHTVTLIALYRNQDEYDLQDKLKPFCSRLLLAKRPAKPWQPRAVLRGSLTLTPFVMARNFSPEALTIIKDLLGKEHFDVIHVETSYMMQHIPKTSVPIVMIEHTLEYQVYNHYVNTKMPLLVRPLFKLEILKLMLAERACWKQAQVVGAVSEVDKKEIERLEPGVKTVLLPNGAGDEVFVDQVDTQKWDKNNAHPQLLFVGNFNWMQNQEAALYLIKNLLPLLKSTFPYATLTIAGQFTKSLNFEGVNSQLKIVDIPADDHHMLPILFKESTVMLAPIWGPGGTRLKLLAAMAGGTPIITTTTGIAGIDLVDGESVEIANEPSAMIEKLKKLLGSEKHFQNIQENAFKIAKERYSWEAITKRIVEVYKSL